MMYYTTLKKLREHNACSDRYAHLVGSLPDLGDGEPLRLDVICHVNGVHDALWALRASDAGEREMRLLACDFAEHIFTRRTSQEVKNYLATTRRWAVGEATRDEVEAAEWASYEATYENVFQAADWAAHEATEWAAGTAATAATAYEAAYRTASVAAHKEAIWAAHVAKERAWQTERFLEWCEEGKVYDED